MNWSSYRTAVLHRASLAAGYSACRAPGDEGKADKVLAAAAIVIADKGPDWCIANPRAFTDLVKANLGTVVRVVLTVVSLLTGGGTWLLLLRTLLPAVLEYLAQRRSVYGSSDSDLNELRAHARLILEGHAQ